MAKTYQILQDEFYARGFAYLNDGGAGAARAGRWVNDANQKINDMEPWLYLLKSTSGAGPLSISDLGRVQLVYAAGVSMPLTYMDVQGLADNVGALTTAGVPAFYYITGSVIQTWPTTTSTLTVLYHRVDPVMTANLDEPSMPDRFRMAIVHYAVAEGLRDKSNFAEADAAELAGDRVVQRMREYNALLPGSPERQTIVGASDDWGSW